ncbi:MAG: type II secretion system F family protein [Oscillospiraceae bacterium]|nr:type II secretion system F family protein [Oscillospiraceae bacterium]
MQNNMFEDTSGKNANEQKTALKKLYVPDYSESPCTILDHILSFMIGGAAGFAVLFIFYKIVWLSVVGALVVGVIYIFVAEQNAIRKRKMQLRVQFFDMLEAMSVAMRAGNPVLKALQSAKADLAMIYPENSDILLETEIIIQKFNNAVSISEAFSDFAQRSELEDIASFASVYATIEGKSSRADEIVRETQQIIADKMEIEMEIETLMTAAKSEVNIMLFMPLVILGVIGYAGAGFMDSIYTTAVGRLVATGGLIVFIISFILARKFSNVEI